MIGYVLQLALAFSIFEVAAFTLLVLFLLLKGLVGQKFYLATVKVLSTNTIFTVFFIALALLLRRAIMISELIAEALLKSF